MFFFDPGFKWWAEVAEGQKGRLDWPRSGTVRVDYFGIEDVFRAHQASNLSQGQFQLFRLRGGGGEQAVLDPARLGWLDAEADFFDGLIGRVRFERMLHQPEQELDVASRKREPHHTLLPI